MTKTICFLLFMCLLQMFGQTLPDGTKCYSGTSTDRCDEALVRKWIVATKFYADNFVWPLLTLGPTNPATNTFDPKVDGWYVWNGVGHYCPNCSTYADKPFHPGEDINRQDGKTGSQPVYAPANGIVVRDQDAGDNGHFLMIASLMRNKVSWSPFVIPGTTVPSLPTSAADKDKGGIGLSDWVTFDNIHVDRLVVQLGQKVNKGDLVAYVSDSRRHLHWEVISGFGNSTGGPAISNTGYYATQQEVTSFNTLVATAGMSRLINPYDGVYGPFLTGLAAQNFDNDGSGYDKNGWTPSGLWHVSSNRKYSGSYSFQYSRADGTNNYAITTSSVDRPNGGILMSPVFIAPANPTVKFKTYYETEPQQVDAQGNITRALGTVDKKQVYAQRVGSDDVLLVGEITANTSGGAWQDTAMAIPAALAGLPIRIWFVFNSVDSSNNGYEGWYVDDVSVVTDATVNSQTAVVTPTITGMDYAIVGTDSSGKAVINGKFYGSNLNYAGLMIRFFGPGCEKEGLCSVSADQSKSSSTTVYFSAVLGKAVYSVKVKNGNLGLYASSYFEINGNSPANGTCQVSPSASSLKAPAAEAAWQSTLIDEKESITLDSTDAPITEEVVEGTGSQQGEPETDPLLQTAEPENPPAPTQDQTFQDNGIKAGSQMRKPLAAVCSSFGLTPASQSQTVVPGGSKTYPVGLSTSVTQQVSFTMVIYAAAVPAGIWASYPSAQSYTANTSYPLNVQIGTSTATPTGSYLFGMRAWINGIMVQEVQMTLVVAASAPPLQFSPTSQSANVVAGSSNTFSFALKNTTSSSQSVTFAMYTMEATNPAGITASWPPAQTLAAGASVNLTATIFTTTATPQRQINFEVRATASGVTVAEALAIVVTATSTPALTVSLSSSNLSPTVNTAVTLTATPSGGSGTGYSCSWNISSSTACSISYTPTTTGNIAISVTAKDSAGKVSSPASLTLSVQAAVPTTGTIYIATTNSIAVSCSINGSAVTAPVTLTGQATGSKTLSCSNPSGYTASITSANPQTLSAGGTVNFTVSLTAVPLPTLTVSCYFSPSSITLGTGTTVYLSSSGVSGGVSYTVNGVNIGSITSYAQMPSSVGTYTATVTAKDGAGRSAQNACYATVNPPPLSVASYAWVTLPVGGVFFSGYARGNGFVSGLSLQFCVANTSTCYPHSLWQINSLSELYFYNVMLTKGSWQVLVTTPYGSTRGPAFSVQ